MLSSLHLPKSLRRKIVAACFVFGLPVLALAQSDEGKNQPSDEGAEAIQAIAKLVEGEKWDLALVDVQKAKAKAKPGSFDLAYFNQMEGMVYVNKRDFSASISGFETALKLAIEHNYFTKSQVLELTFTVAQLYGQLAGEAKAPADQQKYWDLSVKYMRDWIAKNPKPHQDGVYFVAQSLYFAAAVNGSERLDPATMQEVIKYCNQALRLGIKIKESAAMLLVAGLQQVDRFDDAAEYLELLAFYYPNNKTYWTSLANTYIMAAEKQQPGPEKDSRYLKAILTFERAQKIGLLNTPKDNFYLVGLLSNTEQFDAAIDLLERGLKDGSLEPTLQNWQLLAQSYQEIKKDMKAIETFKAASKVFPKNSDLDLQIANLYYGLDKLPEALEYLKLAVKKGVDKPAPTQVFIAYISLELKQLEAAKSAAEEALRLDPSSVDAKKLLESTVAELEEREKVLKAKNLKM